MKWLIFLSFAAIFICFAVKSDEKRPEIKEKQKFRVSFNFWAAKETKFIDSLKFATLRQDKDALLKMRDEKQIIRITEENKVVIQKLYPVLGTPYVEAKVLLRGKNKGTVYILEPFIHQFCVQDKK